MGLVKEKLNRFAWTKNETKQVYYLCGIREQRIPLVSKDLTLLLNAPCHLKLSPLFAATLALIVF